MKSKDKKKVTCYSCGKEYNMTRDKNCPAKGKKCAKCGKYGHFAACCKAQTASGNRFGGDRRGRSGRDGQRKTWNSQGRGTANCVGESDSEEDEFAFAVTEEVECVCATTHEPVVLVSINGIHKDALDDSGSVSNLISLNEFISEVFKVKTPVT